MNGEHVSSRPEPGIGRSLRRAREERGLTLQQVEQRTKIRARYLRGLEREDFGVLPTVYVLGSLKTYADHLGLDGADLSRQLKARLEQPAEPDLPSQLAALREMRDDEYEAAPMTAVGFDQLFLGMGAVVISILVIMTVVTAFVRGDESPVSQLDEPSTPEASSEIALAGNVLDKPDRQPRNEGAPAGVGNDEDGRDTDEKDDQPENDSGPSKDDKDRPEQEPGNASSPASVFDDVKFVPMSPPSSSSSRATAPATNASPTPASSASATSTPASSASVRAAPSSPAPAASEPDSASVPPAPAGVRTTGVEPPGGGRAPLAGGSSTAPSVRDVPARPTDGPPGADEIANEVAEKIDGAFEENGIGQ